MDTRNLATTVALVILFLLPAFMAGPSGSLWGFILLVTSLGLPFLLLWLAYRNALGRGVRLVVLAFGLVFVMLDVPLFLGAGMATPIVGIAQSTIAALLALTAWLVRKRSIHKRSLAS